MKLVIAIINNEDANKVSDALNDNGFPSTRLATTGGFLQTGNTTVLIGAKDSETDKIQEIIAANTKRRERSPSKEAAANNKRPEKAQVAAATIFVLNIDDFRKM